MRQKTAIQLMRKGIKVTHWLFSSDEYIAMEGGKIVTEEGYKMPAGEFWSYRRGENWEDGYSVYEEKTSKTEYCQVVNHFIGRMPTEPEAYKALELHEAGDGGNTVGWKFTDKLDREIRDKITHEEHTTLGDALIEIGRILRDK